MKIFQNRYVRYVLQVVFSNTGLCVLVSGYIVLGALLFQDLETDNELNRKRLAFESSLNVEKKRQLLIDQIINFVQQCSGHTDISFKSYSDFQDADCHAKERFINRTQTWLNEYHMFIFQQRNSSDYAYTGQKMDNTTLSQLNQWSLPSAILFTASILTTIGYGNPTPKTQIGQLTVVLYATLALPLMSFFLVNVGGRLADALRYLVKKLSCQKLRDNKRFYWATKIWATSPQQAEAIQQNPIPQTNPALQKTDVPALVIMAVGVAYTLIGMVLFHATEGWTFVESLYFTFISLCTIGFGDFMPSADNSTPLQQMRLVMTSFYLLVGLALLAMCISLLMSTIKISVKKAQNLLQGMVQKLKAK